MNRVRWKWSATGAGTTLTVRFEHLKLEFVFSRKAFSSGWEIKVGRSTVILTGLSGRRTIRACCNIMRRAHGRAILRLFAGLEV